VIKFVSLRQHKLLISANKSLSRKKMVRIETFRVRKYKIV